MSLYKESSVASLYHLDIKNPLHLMASHQVPTNFVVFMQVQNLVGCKEQNITISEKLCAFVDNHERKYTLTLKDTFDFE